MSLQDARLSIIATDHTYRRNFTAADNQRNTQRDTIKTIIEMIVCTFCENQSALLLSFLQNLFRF